MSLQVRPVLVYETHQRREAISWRPWGGIQTEEDARNEERRIADELQRLASRADFALDILPLIAVKEPEDVAGVHSDLIAADVLLVYAAGGGLGVLSSVTECSKWSLVFLRHRSGPLYLWYEIIHPMLLRHYSDVADNPHIGVDDIVVDSYDELLWRLRALSGLKKTFGTRIVALGGLSAWGMWRAPEIKSAALSMTQDKFRITPVPVTYGEFTTRIQDARKDSEKVEHARAMAEAYLRSSSVSLETKREFVDKAFLVYLVFKDLMAASNARAITVMDCMTTIIPLAETTACLPLSLINDEGDLAFCESDFVVIPAGVLLHNISGKPVFLNDPTYPHDAIITLAHCTSPRKMNGQDLEPVRVLTHFESDYGAAPKVEFREGQKVTVIVPDFRGESWVGFKGEIAESPFYPICRSQADVRIEGDWRQLLAAMRGFHFMMGYDDYTKELGYALHKVGLQWALL